MTNLTTEERQHKWELFEQGLKLCRKCGRILPLGKFDRCKSKTDGVDSRCKTCKKARIPNAGRRKRKTKRRKALYAQGLRECMDCHQIKSTSEFSKNKSGPEELSSYCRECERAKSKRGNTGKRAQKKKEQQELAVQGLKRCSTCKRILPVSEFYSGLSHTYDGRATQCRQCMGYKGAKKQQQEERLFLAQYGLKRCGRCNLIFPISQFWKNTGTSDGLTSICKDCFRGPDSLRAVLQWEFKVAEREWLATKDQKRCNRCGKVKPRDDFSYQEDTWDKLNFICRTCSREKGQIARRENPGPFVRGKHRRRARQAQVEATLTEEEWQSAIEFWDHCCCYCGQYTEVLCREHLVPLSAGGNYSADNIVPSCRGCNCSKSNLPFDKWASGRGAKRMAPDAKEKIQEYFATLLQED